ncbi:MAG TPA: TonB-dependent receptor [Gammaproteobacteria bacterium]|nr:TonB-dependent receptor [Gammaproteobacteria bacterium]
MPHYERQRGPGLLALVLVTLAVCQAATAEDPGPGARYFGQSVIDVLESLRGEGLQVVYSTDLVGRHLLVTDVPESSVPEDIASEILAPHGLVLRVVDGIHFVTRRDPPELPGAAGSILAVVKDASSDAPLDRSSVRLIGSRIRAKRLSSGSFQLRPLEPGAYALAAEAAHYEPRQLAGIDVQPGQTAIVVVELEPAEAKFETVSVTASRYDLTDDIQSSLALFSRDDVQNLPDLGEDPLRTAQHLPGTASARFSARSHIRGGEENETLIVLDGLPLVDPFHVRDYNNIFSTVDQRAISEIEVYTGGFPVEYGNRMSGVIAIETLDPGPDLHHEIGLSVFNTSLLSSGEVAGGRGEWLVSARRGNLDKVIDDQFGEPSYNDVLLHGGLELTDGMRLSANALISNDEVTVITESDDDEQEQSASRTRNAHFWLRLENDWTPRLRSDTVLSHTRFENDRGGIVDTPDELTGRVQDTRNMRRAGVTQSWQWRANDDHLLRWGAEFARWEANYAYESEVELAGFLANIAGVPESRMRSIDEHPDGDSVGLYVTDKLRLTDRLTLEAGVRWDRQTYIATGGDSQVSPRFHALYRLSEHTDLRASWGRFFQAQEIQDLQVADGVRQFFPAQRADHSILSVQHRFAPGLTLRGEAFWKSFERLRPRFENLFDPLALLPELEPDRVRVSPEDARSRGIELLLARDTGDALGWWASYAYTKVSDDIGGRDVPRNWDQRHSVQGGVNWIGEKWDFAVAAIWRSGWPTTELLLEPMQAGVDEDDVETRFGARNSGRLGSFSNIDIRINRRFELPHGRLNAFVEVTNVFNSANPCCVEYDLEIDDAGNPMLLRGEDDWLPLLPSIGVLYEF